MVVSQVSGWFLFVIPSILSQSNDLGGNAKNLCFLHRQERDGNTSIPSFGSPPSLVAEGLTPTGSVPYLSALAMMPEEAVLADAQCAAAKGPHKLLCMGYRDEVPEDLVVLIGHPVPGKVYFSLSLL